MGNVTETRRISGFWNEAEREPDRPAVIHARDGSVSFGELAVMANQISNAAVRDGLVVGDAIAVVMRNRMEFLATWLATFQTGLFVVPISWHLTPEELAYILTDAEPSLIMTDQSSVVEAVQRARISDVRVVAVDDVPGADARFDDWLSGVSSSRPSHRTMGGRMAYTSGTTGRPKGVRRALIDRDPDESVAGGATLRRAELFDLMHPDGVHLLVCPQYHGAPGSSAINALHLGQPVVMSSRWDSAAVLDLMMRHRVTNTYMVPTMFHRLLQLPDEMRSSFDPSHLRSVVHAGARCPVDLKLRMIAWWGEVFFDWYGATEGGVSMVNTRDWLARPGTVGRPMPGSAVSIRDEHGNELPPGQPGMIYAKQQSMEFEYFKDPEKTAAAHQDGYFTVGDVGYVDDEGWLFILDRAADMVISGGVNIYPAEVEDVLLAHPSIHDVAVVGVPDDEWGESVVAVVVAEPGVSFDEEAVFAHCREHLARYKVPRRIEIWDIIPRSEAGKVLKASIRSGLVEGRA